MSHISTWTLAVGDHLKDGGLRGKQQFDTSPLPSPPFEAEREKSTAGADSSLRLFYFWKGRTASRR